MRTVKIVTLSGGYDSTGLLFWAMGHKDWHIIAHHVDLVNSENRSGLERESVKKIIAYCRGYRTQFEYSETKFENMDPIHFCKDIVNVGFIAAIISMSAFIKYGRIDRESPDVEVFTGGTLEDNCDEQVANMDGIGIKNKVFEAMYAGFDVPGAITPRISIPFKNTPKQEVVRHIPRELLPHIWTCRNPVRMDGRTVECGVCIACFRKSQITLPK